MKDIVSQKSECYGCTACANICPKSAIQMQEDEEGFVYPCIDEDKCIDCKLCEKVCPYHNKRNVSEYKQRYFAAQHTNLDVVLKSSSGGVFTALSDAILKQNGTVYGVAFTEAFCVQHERAATSIERERFIGSKYIQSDMSDIMRQVVMDLREGRRVMFTGTPCQISGMYNYASRNMKDLSNLFLCDFICHGVSSPKVWRKFIEYIEKEHGSKLVRYTFRDKKNGWHFFQSGIFMQDRDVSEEHKQRKSYFNLYKTRYINRPSCYECPYTSYERNSDVTIADFWNIKSVIPEMDDDKGTSQVLVNTLKGESWLMECKNDLKIAECSKQDVWQPHLEYAETMPKGREKFWAEFYNEEFDTVMLHYGQGSFMSKLKTKAMPIVKKVGLYTLLGKMYRVLFARKEKRKHGE